MSRAVTTIKAIFPKKELKDMSKQEKVLACYQHACLLFEDNLSINNQSVRERFQLDKNKSAVASRIIADTLEAGYIKIANNDIASKKYATYDRIAINTVFSLDLFPQINVIVLGNNHYIYIRNQ